MRESKVRGLGLRGGHQLNQLIGQDQAAVENMYHEKLEHLGVVGVSVETRLKNDGSHTKVEVEMTLTFKKGEPQKGIIERYVDVSAVEDLSPTELRAYCGASGEEAEAFIEELKEGLEKLSELDETLFEFGCFRYALSGMANNNGGSWEEEDTTSLKEVFGLVL